jgi:hypothetical protein
MAILSAVERFKARAGPLPLRSGWVAGLHEGRNSRANIAILPTTRFTR